MHESGCRKKNWKKVALSIACAVLAFVLALMLVATVYIEVFLGKIGRFDEVVPTLSQEELDAIWNNGETGTSPDMNEDDVNFGSDSLETIGGDDIINIMLIGQDRRAGQGRQRSDAMILCTVNKKTGELTMTSFLRDVYVNIPGYRNNKINACYQIGGSKLLNDCLAENFGIQVDANVEVDFNGFMKLIDVVGGVDISLTKREADYLNSHGNWDVESNKGWHLKEGVNKLNGSQALAYSRIRAIGMDFERTERQRKVITALVNSVRNLSLLEINSLVMSMAELVTTDMSNQEMIGYVAQLFPLLKSLKINTQRVPADGTYRFADLPGAGDSIVIDFDANRQFLVDTLKK